MHGEGTIKDDHRGAQRAAAVGVLEPAATGSDELQTRRIHQVQRRILVVLVLTQILGGAGVGAGVAIAALSATRLSGSDVLGGLALMCSAGGAALTAASTPRIAVRAGRRSALLVGYLSAVVGAVAAASPSRSGAGRCCCWGAFRSGLRPRRTSRPGTRVPTSPLRTVGDEPSGPCWGPRRWVSSSGRTWPTPRSAPP